MLRRFLGAKEVSQVQLSRDTGVPKSSILDVLSGKTQFSRQMIRTIADYFTGTCAFWRQISDQTSGSIAQAARTAAVIREDHFL
jgi:plasmid maintenance system antidote protein VapI